MTQFEKLLKKFLSAPTSLSFREIEKILLVFGFEKREGKGSHTQFRHREHRIVLSFPIHQNNCKEIYKKQAAACIQKIRNS